MTKPTCLLLLSNSRNYGQAFLEHAVDPINNLANSDDIVFVPFALADHDSYGKLIAESLADIPSTIHVATPDDDGAQLISEAPVLFVGGGNTFRLLKTVQQMKILKTIAERHAEGTLRYIGSSAGTNLACPTIRTTNDMPIVSPDGFEALGLVPFQINAHFQDDDAFEGHMGETRRTRLTEFLEENEVPVLALREGAWIERQDGRPAPHRWRQRCNPLPAIRQRHHERGQPVRRRRTPEPRRSRATLRLPETVWGECLTAPK